MIEPADRDWLRTMLRAAEHRALGATDARVDGPENRANRRARQETRTRLRSILASLDRADGTERDLRLLADRAHALAMHVLLQSPLLEESRELVAGVLDLVDAYGAPKRIAGGAS